MTSDPALPAVRAIGLSKRYGRSGPFAIRDLDLDVMPGSITGLLGPNGAGKTTLIRACVGFERPTEGRVEVQGIDPRRRPSDVLARVGYVPQGGSLYGDVSVAEHVTLAATLRSRYDQRTARRHLDALEIPMTARARDLSGGQQAQVMLALVLGCRSEVLLLDEPLASLDPLARRDFLHVLREDAAATGATVLLSSHVVSDVAQACDRIVVLGGGRKVLDASIADVIQRHAIVDADRGAETPQVGRIIGTFRGLTGDPISLVERPPEHATPGSDVTLEDVVLGYLAQSRARSRAVAEPSA